MTDLLHQARLKIDHLDNQILDIISQRAKVIEDITIAKSRQVNLAKITIFDPQRENQIIDRMLAANTSKLPKQAITDIFQTVIKSCRNLQYSNLITAETKRLKN